ncbi:recombinase family protein [Streptomyces uncialis]
MGYARCSTAQQKQQSQLDALDRANCKRVFSEKISTRVKVGEDAEARVRHPRGRVPPGDASHYLHDPAALLTDNTCGVSGCR